MTLLQLRASRALWRRREVYRYRKWAAAKKRNNAAGRERWWKLYDEAHDQRVHRDHQIAARRGKGGVSPRGVDLVAQFEGFRSHPYRDAVGVWTIGYGETKGVGPRTKPISQKAAKELLRKRLNRDFAPAVRAASKKPLTQNQLDGFTSFVYNVGTGGVAADTHVGRYLRAGNIGAAANSILDWDKAGGRVLAGLSRRRHAERALILR